MMFEAFKSRLRLPKMQKRKGVTMVIMLIFVPIIMIVAASYVEPIIRSYRASVNDQKTLLAKAVADSMFELALWESRGGGTGTVSEGCICQSGSCEIGTTACDDGYDFGYGTATGQWHVFGTPETDAEHLIVEGSNEWYTIPSLGSGTAGGDYCSTAEPVVDEQMLTDKLTQLVGVENNDVIDDPFDWPCHWNKIREGESVVIPLFTENADGTVNNPIDLGLNQFQLRFRAACDPDDPDPMPAYPDSICNEGQRYFVEGDPLLGNDTIIVLWEIVGDEVDAGGVPTGKKIILGPYKEAPWVNTFINNININDYKNSFRILKETSQTEDNNGDFSHTIIQHLDFNLPHIYNHLYISRPYLNLLVIHTLREGTNPPRTIPYLEYQFKAILDSPSSAPISSTSKVVRVDVMVDGGYSETLEKTIALPKPVSGFVISQ